MKERGGWYIIFLCPSLLFMRQVYPKNVYHNSLPLHMKLAIIIGEEEGISHHFVHGEEIDTTYTTILSQPTLYQKGDNITEKGQ